MVRYPHNAELIVPLENGAQDANGDFISGKITISIIGRYEPSSKKIETEYTAKFYTPIFTGVPFSKDGFQLKYQNRLFKVVQFHNYQKHCELWLE